MLPFPSRRALEALESLQEALEEMDRARMYVIIIL